MGIVENTKQFNSAKEQCFFVFLKGKAKTEK
jgi:hypothetical protein